MSEKQTNHSVAPLPKKSKAKRKRSNKRSNHKRAIASAPKKRPEHNLKQEEHEPDISVAEAAADTAFDRDEAKDFTFVGALLEMDAFLLEDDADDGYNELSLYSESPAETSPDTLEPDVFLLGADEGIASFDGLKADEGTRAPARGPTAPNAAPAPTGMDAQPIGSSDDEEALALDIRPISDFKEEYTLGTLLIASSSASEGVDTSQAVLIDGDGDIAVREQDVLPRVIDTPLPASIEEDEPREAPYNVREWYPGGEPLPHIPDTPLPSFSYKPWYEYKRVKALRKVAALCLLALFIVSSILLWGDLSDTHLYVYTLDPSSGDVIAQQDIGGGYQGKTTITDSVQVGSTLVFGVRTAQTSTQVKQQVLTLTGRGTSWHVDNEFAAPLSSGTLSKTTDGHLIVENANGLQVMNSKSHVIWSMQGDQPALGAHAFQPVSGNEMLYTMKSARSGEVAGYDLANGALRWMETLDDTFNYSPPLLLSAGILYIAGDSNLYALNSVDGSMLWRKQWPARSLFLLNNGQSNSLLAVGAQGLAAFDAATGALSWSFNGQPRSKTLTGAEQLTDAQFYQAGIDSGNNVIYATGIVWDALQVREQLWLYAVDGTTGALRWSEPVGSGFESANAGRIFTPLVDTDYGLVTLEQEQDNGGYSINAFDANNGASRWSMHFDGESAAAPMLLQAASDALLHLKVPRGKKHLNSAVANIPDTVLILPVTQSNIPTTLHSWSHIRLLLMGLIMLSLLGLLFLWMFPLHLWILRQQDHIHNIRHNVGSYLLYPLKLVLRFWRYSHRLFALAILLLVVGGGVLEYVHLNQPENGLYAIAGSTGNTRWQRINSSPIQTMLADAQGTIDNLATEDHLHQLSGLDRNGVSEWTTFASEGNFSVPSAATPPGTVLVALSGPTTLNYQFAPDDPAYPHLQEHILNLYLLNRRTGQILWLSNVARPDQQQDAVVLGADARFIYVASRETYAGPHSRASTVQLIAVNLSTGNIEWRIFGPQEANDAPIDDGSLLLQSRLIFWQVAGTIYSIDTTLGQIQWRRSIIEDTPGILLTEEPQMAEAAGILLVERSNIYYVLDAASGNEFQSIANPSTDTVQSLAGVIAVGNIFLIYGDSTVEAMNATTRQIIWKQGEFDAIQGLKISDDEKMIYVVELNSVDQSIPRPVQALTALDLKTGTVRWTFQPSDQASFVDPQSNGFQYDNGIVFATICMPDAHSSCGRERLYAINGATGDAMWKFEAKSIFDLHVSSDGGPVLLQTDSTEWINLIGRFRS